MKFLYDQNQDYTQTHELFSQEEIRAHIDRYFKNSRTYLQTFVDREPLARRWGRPMLIFGVLLCVGGFFNGVSPGSRGEISLVSSLSCAFLVVGLLLVVMGTVTLLHPSHAPAAETLPQKGKDKSKKASPLTARKTAREIAYEELLGRGRLYEGKISEIVDLEPPLRQIRFTFAPDPRSPVYQSAFFVTESPVELAPYDTLVVLSNGTVTVLL